MKSSSTGWVTLLYDCCFPCAKIKEMKVRLYVFIVTSLYCIKDCFVDFD